MKNKRFKKFLLTCTCLLSLLGSTSCASFFGGESGALITDISSKQDESGNTIITVEFDSDEYAPVEVTIPKGVGIDRIEHSLNGDTSVNLKIYYTDENMSPTELSLPIIKGDDGKGVSNVTCDQKEDGNYELVFEMTDGTKFGPFPIQKGKDAKNIINVEATTNDESGYTTITVTFDDDTTLSADIELGKDGRGIEYIETLPDIGNNYVIRVHYSDGTSEEVQFAKPSTNRWFSGATSPAATLGSDGDYYIDTSSKSFYMKTSGSWLLLFSLDESETNKQTFKVTFDKNGGEWDWTSESTPSGDTRQFSYEEGSFIDFDIAELKVVKAGYTFNGWWTDAEINANSGHFTKLTPVTCDMMLYANWIENA